MKSIMEYGGYYSKIEYSDEDEVFFGRIADINDSVTFEGTSVTELKQNFKEAVEDYLDICKRYGKEPQKPYKGSFNVRIPPELHRKAANKAGQMGISLNQLVEISLEENISGEYTRLERISERIGSAASQISRQLYESTADLWSSKMHHSFSNTFEFSPKGRSFVNGRN